MGVGTDRLNSTRLNSTRLSSTQRIRYGLTGLALVFLLVLLGAAVIRSSDEGPANVALTNTEPNEPLAELGVAPGQTDANTVAADQNQAQ